MSERSAGSLDTIQILRNHTSAAHQDLESRLVIGGEGVSVADYQNYVRAMFGWLGPLEPILWNGTWSVDLEPETRGSKSSWLRADLLAAGCSPEILDSLPARLPSLDLSSEAAKFGVAYVVEGAQLGGQVLKRRFEGLLQPEQSRWLEGYGRQTGPLWRSFLLALNERVKGEEAQKIASDAAVSTFEDLSNWFQSQGVARREVIA
jgi:heme oxygenase